MHKQIFKSDEKTIAKDPGGNLRVFSVSCQENETRNVNLAAYDQIGAEHNRQLDEMFNVMKVYKDEHNGVVNIEDVLDAFKGETLKDLKGNDIQMDFVTDAAESARATMFNVAVYRKQTGQIVNDLFVQEVKQYMTANQREFLDKIHKTFTDDGAELESTLSKFDNIQREILQKCTDNELHGMLVSVSIAKHSFQYWNQNASKWKAEFSSKDGRGMIDPNWKVVGGMDVAGGAVMAISCSTAVVVPFVGWGFLAVRQLQQR